MLRQHYFDHRHDALWQSLPVLTATALLLTLCGCGGGSAPGAGSASGGSDSGQPFQFGALSGRAALTNPPTTTNGNGATVTAVKGSIESLTLNDTSKNLAETRLAFATNRDGNYEIYTINPDGTNPIRLTNTSARDVHPTWSPDGRKIAFVSDRDGNNEIYVMNAITGSIIGRLTNNTFDDIDPAWSPDGKKIVFSSKRDGQQYDLYTMNSDGSGQTQLTHTTTVAPTNNVVDEFRPTWAPDSKRIACSQQTHDPLGLSAATGVYVFVDATGNETIAGGYTSGGSPPTYALAWSPDGSQLATSYFSLGTGDVPILGGGLGIVSVGSAFGSVTPPASAQIGYLFPTWSPDSSKLAYVKLSNVGTASVFGAIMVADLRQNYWTETRIGFDGAANIDLAWSPFSPPRQLLGAGGALGNSAAGFLFATGTVKTSSPQDYTTTTSEIVSSVVVFNALKPLDITLTNQTGLNNTGPSLVYSLDADAPNALTQLAFVQNPDYKVTTIIGTAGTPYAQAAGALINFSASTGYVTAVLPYQGTRAAGKRASVTTEGGQRILRGQFLGVWDGTGKNQAERGASEVRLDAKTGAILAVR